MGLPALLMLYCGLRRGELLALTGGDIDLADKALTVNKSLYFRGNTPVVKQPKTKAGVRSIPIPDALIPALKAHRHTSIMVCPDTKDKVMSAIAFRRAWESYTHFLNIVAGGKDASRSHPKVQAIDHITPHMLRHTYCTMLYTAPQVTPRVYTHLSEQKERQAVDALNDHFSSIFPSNCVP